jgi:uncharacterized protein involved in type VI secretion and phage assembly
MNDGQNKTGEPRPGGPTAGVMYGVYLAEVVAVTGDPENLGRIQIRLLGFDGVGEQDAPLWARVAVPFAGANRGAFFIPNKGDEVAVQFVHGDPRLPLVTGGMWNGNQTAPETLGGDEVDRWTFVGRNGTRVAIVEKSQGQEEISLATPNQLISALLTASSGGKIELKTSMGTVKIETSGITVQSSVKVTVEAPQMELKAGYIDIQAAFTNISGIVKCPVLLGTTIIGNVYTPGAGNVW